MAAGLLSSKESERKRRAHNSFKSTNRKTNYSNNEVTEFAKCGRYPIRFIKTYVKILHPVRGRIPFKLWPFQEEVVTAILTHPFNICLKPRQMGLSWLLAAMIVWVMIFFPDKNILVISIKFGAAIRFLDKVKYIIQSLPDFLQPVVVESSKMILVLDNGSRVESISTSEEAGRSEGVSWMIFDEAGFIRWMKTIWAAAFPTLSTGGMCTALSTANGVGNWFHMKMQDAMSGLSGFNPIKLRWDMHPERDKQWYDQMLAELGELKFAQEVLCDFITSGNPFFNPIALRGIEETDVLNPTIHHLKLDIVKRIGKANVPIRVFQEPEPGAFYVIPVDPCKGDGVSKLGLHVLKIGPGYIEQVAVCSEKLPPDVTAHIAAELGYMYNTACIVVEDNKGGVTIKVLQDDLYYPDIYMMEKLIRKDGERVKQGELGFNMNARTRPHILDQLEVATRQETILIHDIVTINQMWNFCYAEGTFKPEARQGYCDDLVLSLAMGYEVAVQFGFGLTRRNSVIKSGAPLGRKAASISSLLPSDSGITLHDALSSFSKPDSRILTSSGVLPE